MKKLLLILLVTFPVALIAQTTGDYRSKITGDWNVVGTWERYNGANWVAAIATPTSADGVITIQNGHTVTNTTAVTVDQVVVASGGTLTQNSTMTINNGAGTDLSVSGTLNFNGGTFNGTGIANIAGIFNWSSGTLSVVTTLTAAATGNFTGNEEIITGTTLTNNGTINWSSNFLSFNSGVLINNKNINNTSNGQLYKYTTGLLTNNIGAFFTKLTGTGTTYTNIDINNSGTVSVQSGILEIYTDTFITSNVVNIAAGATFRNSYISVFNSGSSVTGAGTFHQNNFTLTINNAMALPAAITVTFSGGTINGTGSLSIPGTMDWSGGTLSLPSTLTASSTGNLTGNEQIISGTTLTNNGTINWSSNYLSFNNGTLVNNKNINNTSNAQFYRYTSGLFNNNSGAIFTKLTGTGTTYSNIDINNTGTISVQAGIFEIGADTFKTSSIVNIAAGGTFKNSYVSIFNIGSNITGAGTLQQSNATLTINKTIALPAAMTVTFSGGTINGIGSLSIPGTINWSGGTLSLPLILTASATGNLTGFEQIINGTTLTNNGTINWSSNYLSFNGAILINNKNINNTNNGQLYRYTTGSLSNNSGAVLTKLTATGTMYSNINMNNSGTVSVQAGTLEIASDTFTTNSVVNIAAGATFKNSSISLLNSGTSITGAGILQQSSSSLFVNLALSIPASITFNFTGGTLTGPGGLNIAGLVNWSGGTMNIPCTFTSSAIANFTGFEEILRKTLTNNGTIYWKSIYLSFDSGTLVNNKNFIDSATTDNYFYKYAGPGQFTNGVNGVFQKPTNITSNLNAIPFTNNGTIKGIGTYVFGTNLTNATKGIFAPGNSPGILVTGTGYTNRTLQIEMRSGGAAGNGFDQLQVNGIAQLRDTLKIFRTGVVPEGNYTILTVLGASDSLKGNFSVIQAPPGYTVSKTKKLVRVTVPKPTVSIKDSGLVEGNSGSKFMTFILTLNNPTAVLATVNFATQDSTATLANNDYQNTTGTATFNPGESSDTIKVRIFGDTLTESDEVFKVTLSNPVNILMGDSLAIGTILNNDGTFLAGTASSESIVTRGNIVIPTLIYRSQPWLIQGLSGTKNAVMLFDALGRKVFAGINIQGNINLSPLNKGGYYYQVQVEDATKQNKIYKGKLIIIE